MPERPASEAPDSAPLCFFEGLAWAVPMAFAGALGSFRFEQGDVLHRTREGYAARSEPPADPEEALVLQVLAPPRSARAPSVEGDGDRRRASHESEVTVSMVDVASGARRDCVTTQGRLLMTLWRGDLAWIEGEGEAPTVPLGARDLAGQLEAARPVFEEAFAAVAQRAPLEGSLFLFVVDLASDASRVKAATIRESLAFVEGAVSLDRSPEALALDSAERFHPALVVRGLWLPGTDVDRVTEALRAALYGGRGTTTAEGGEGESDAAGRFSVARHGLLVPLGD